MTSSNNRKQMLVGLGMCLVGLGSACTPPEPDPPPDLPSVPEPMASLGSLSGETDAFGLISGLLVTADGELVVLDGRSYSVRVFDRLGRLAVAHFGKPGQGPGEFLSPVSIGEGQEGELIVADERAHSASVFGRVESGYEYRSRVDFEMPPRSMCSFPSMGIHAIHSQEDSGLVGVYSSDGSLIRRFVEPSDHPNRLMRMSEDRLVLYCDQPHQRIIAQREISERIEAYDLGGRLIWSSALPGYMKMVVEELANGAVQYSTPPAGYYHMGSDMVGIASARVLVQVAELDSDHPRPLEAEEFLSFIIDSEDGAVIDTRSDLPRLVARSRDGTWIGFSNLPFPRVLFYDSSSIKF